MDAKLTRPGLLLYPLALVFLSCCSLQSGNTKAADYAEIPFVIENKRIVVEAAVHGRKGRFIFDTGATESYLDIDVKKLLPLGTALTSHEGQKLTVRYYRLKSITFGDVELKTRSWVINQSDYLTRSQTEGYDGILGSRTFEGYWCELSFSKRKIILHRRQPDYFTLFSPVKILNKYDADFFVPVVIDGEQFYFAIDTGAPAGLYFPLELVQRNECDGPNEIPVNGNGEKAYHLIKTETVDILDERFTGLCVRTNAFFPAADDDPYKNLGVLGLDFLLYYDFLFDYRKLRQGKTTGLFYEPNTPPDERKPGPFGFIQEPDEALSPD